jgi:hypothetical protein
VTAGCGRVGWVRVGAGLGLPAGGRAGPLRVGRAVSLAVTLRPGFSGIVRSFLPELSRRSRSNDINGPPMSLTAGS